MDKVQKKVDVAGEEFGAAAERTLGKLTPSIDVPKIWFGGCGDGRYPVPKDFSEIDLLYSPGVGSTVDFDLSYANLGTRVRMLDPTLDRPPLEHVNFEFQKLGLGVDLSLEDWLHSEQSEIPHPKRGLQIDIEGGEWLVLGSLLSRAESLLKFQWILIELHDLDRLWWDSSAAGMRESIDLMVQHFHPVHLSPNNCGGSFMLRSGTRVPRVVELLLLRKDLNGNITAQSHAPAHADRRCWYADPVSWPF
jgi:hypothetical protein